MTHASLTDPLHWSGPPSECAWTTVNISEAMPDVPTPLTWSFYRRGIDESFFNGFHALGAISRSELRAVRRADERSCAIFHGYPALNVSVFRAMAARMPGSSGDAVEEQLFGGIRFGWLGEQRTRKRYPVIAAKTPALAWSVPGRLRKAHADTAEWWRRAVSPPPAGERAAELLTEAYARFVAIYDLHFFGSMLAQGAYEHLSALAKRSGYPGLEASLVSGYGDIHELTLIEDVWKASRGTVTLSDLLIRHGYHAKDGEIASRSWREDPVSVENLVARYRALPDDSSPAAALALASESRCVAEKQFLAELPARMRPQARIVLALVQRYVPCREVGKAGYLLALDAARAAARSLGENLHREGTLRGADDIYYFTCDEITAGLTREDAETAAFRRDRRDGYRELRLPESWRGMPVPQGELESSAHSLEIRGLPVSSGRVEGRARIVKDPSEAELEPGDVLICMSTDPSWAPLFFQAAGVVIDVGGTLSHGAIVARELGIPCVINTRVATAKISDGSRIRLDGDSGTVSAL